MVFCRPVFSHGLALPCIRLSDAMAHIQSTGENTCKADVQVAWERFAAASRCLVRGSARPWERPGNAASPDEF